MKVKKGFSEVFNKKTFGSLLKLLAGAGTYLATPTLAGINGTAGALTGVGSSTVLGVVTAQPLIALGGWLTFVVHAIYIFVNPYLTKTVGRPLFGWSEQGYALTASSSAASTTATTTVQGLHGLRDTQPGSLMLSDGSRRIVGYPGTALSDVPQVGDGKSMTLRDVPQVTEGRTMRITV